MREDYKEDNATKMKFVSFFTITIIVLSLCASAIGEIDYQHLKIQMVERQIRARGVRDKKVLSAMMKVPRHEFVPEKYINRAYGDYPLPIGEGQTISQPYIVAIMTELLELKEGDKVLEIGTGSGYQAAILGEITREVYTIEIIGKLAGKAKNTLLSQNYDYIKTKVGDGYFGWEEYAPFDAIIVTAAPSHIPPPLKKQLKDGGRMIIPVGMPGAYQTLWQVRKSGEKFEMNNVMGVSFVPFTRAR
jgi:protein-L-isoaspartate(D-aspartate) O-methyltransferase